MGLHPRMGWEKPWGELLPSASASGALLQLCVLPLQPCCTECCPWSLLQLCASTCCSPGVSNVVLGHCCSPMCAPTAVLLHRMLPLVTAAALCIHLLQLWCTKYCPWSLLQPFACTHCSPAAPNIALGHCCSPVHPPAAALVHLTLSWVTAAALCVHPLQPCCTECCPWSLLQPCACTRCITCAPDAVLAPFCSPVHAPTAVLVH